MDHHHPVLGVFQTASNPAFFFRQPDSVRREGLIGDGFGRRVINSMGIERTSTPHLDATQPSDQPLAFELEQVVLDDLLLLGHKLGHVPVAVDPPAPEPRPALARQERDGVARERLAIAEEA